MAALNFLPGDYIAGDFAKNDLAGFDALVFAAGQDPRHLQKGADASAHWERANIEGVPRFFALARQAGIRRAVNIGSFYPQAAPALIADNPYIRSRHLADLGVRVLAGPDFHVVCLNPPYVIGAVAGLTGRSFERYTQYAEGRLPGLAIYAPPGGVNFMSTRSLSEAISRALLHGESGRAYLVGDENLSFKEYLEAFFKAVGNPQPIPVLQKEHPLIGSYAEPGGTVYFDPDPAEVALLGYRRNDITRAVQEVVSQYRTT
jgi:dihydroflavonol-4-reductase